MTEIKNMPADSGNDPITVETAKVIQGMSLVFCGALTMLEALHPHVSLAPSAILDLVTGNVEGLEKAAAERRAAAEKVVSPDTGNAEGFVDAADATDTAPTESAVTADAHKDEAEKQTATPAEAPQAEKPQKAEPANTVTADDITKVIVRKIKQDRSNSEKVGAVLKTYGVTKVSELPADKYEAFLTDISQL